MYRSACLSHFTAECLDFIYVWIFGEIQTFGFPQFLLIGCPPNCISSIFVPQPLIFYYIPAISAHPPTVKLHLFDFCTPTADSFPL